MKFYQNVFLFTNSFNTSNSCYRSVGNSFYYKGKSGNNYTNNVNEVKLCLPFHHHYKISKMIKGSVCIQYFCWSLSLLVILTHKCLLLYVCLSFSFVTMALSVYFLSMSLTVQLVSFAPLL